MPALHCVRQFLLAATAELRGEGAVPPEVERLLPTGAARLFARMPRYDRRHALGVMRTLRDEGHDDRDLLAAALLHDVGKTGTSASRLRLWHRVLMVLVRAAAPGKMDRLADADGGSWGRAFFVQVHHAQLGAELALGAGCSPATAELIAHHEWGPAPGNDPRLGALQAADAAN